MSAGELLAPQPADNVLFNLQLSVVGSSLYWVATRNRSYPKATPNQHGTFVDTQLKAPDTFGPKGARHLYIMIAHMGQGDMTWFSQLSSLILVTGMKRPMQHAEQQESPSNITKYCCNCH